MTIASKELEEYLRRLSKQPQPSKDIFHFFIVVKDNTTYRIHELNSTVNELSLETRRIVYRLRNLQDRKLDRLRLINPDGHTVASSEPHVISEIWRHFRYLFGGLAGDLHELKLILNRNAIENSFAKNQGTNEPSLRGLKRGSDEFSNNNKRPKSS